MFGFVAGQEGSARPRPQLRDAHVPHGSDLGSLFGNTGIACFLEAMMAPRHRR